MYRKQLKQGDMEILNEIKNLHTFGFKFDINTFQPIKNDFPKPKGGLWAIEEENVRNEDPILELFTHQKVGFKFDLLDARILVIEFYEDVYDLFDENENYILDNTLNFERIAEDYDAIVISDYAAEVLSDPFGFEEEIDFKLDDLILEGTPVIEVPYLDFGSVIVFNSDKIKNVRNLEVN